jgi:hypothetical protein
VKARAALRRKEPNIYRYEHNGSHEWVVAFKRAGKPYVEYFADGIEGPEASFRRAVEHRDWLKPRIPPWNKLHRRSSPNRSGIIGVCVVNDRTRAGRRVRRWVASWYTADGRREKRSFSVPKYGERRAKALAIEARRRGVEEMLRARAKR